MGPPADRGPQRKEFLQHVLTSNVSALDLNMAQYCIIPNQNGGAVDDAYLYLFQEDNYLLVVNAANIDKDLEHLNRHWRASTAPSPTSAPNGPPSPSRAPRARKCS